MVLAITYEPEGEVPRLALATLRCYWCIPAPDLIVYNSQDTFDAIDLGLLTSGCYGLTEAGFRFVKEVERLARKTIRDLQEEGVG